MNLEGAVSPPKKQVSPNGVSTDSPARKKGRVKKRKFFHASFLLWKNHGPFN